MQIDNYAIAEQFSLLSKLMEIHGENSFKARSYAAAAFNIERLQEQLYTLTTEDLTSLQGISPSTAEKITEILTDGKLHALDEILQKTPTGVIELLQLKGLGPKKIATIWKEMHIESVGELLYACNENRLTLYKGFGAKTQANIQEAILFYLSQQGHFLFAEIHAIFPSIENYLIKSFGKDNVSVTGSFRRQDLTIEQLTFVIQKPLQEIKPIFQTAQPPEIIEENLHSITYKLKNGLHLQLIAAPDQFGKTLFETTATDAFMTSIEESYKNINAAKLSEEGIFNALQLHVIPPYLRNDKTFLAAAQTGAFPNVIQPGMIKGIIHTHSNWSDGMESIESMATACIKQGYEYLVISDHSKSAQYAGGLSEVRILEQHKLIDALNQQVAPFKIFKSIECDILGDGSLDYDDAVLSSFDLVIASVHSNLKMSEEKAMQRLLKAIAHPSVRILGHPTGRLLLSRNGYPLDYKTIIDACADHQVVLELNAHPRRLDIDWSWIPYAVSKNVLISINPDAHAIEGFKDCLYGILAAQKGGLTVSNNLSSFSLHEFSNFLQSKK